MGEGEGVVEGSGVPCRFITMTGASPVIGGSVVGKVENMPAGGEGSAEVSPGESLHERSPSISKKAEADISWYIDIRPSSFYPPSPVKKRLL